MGVSHREVNGRLVLAGVLRIFWGIDHSIRLREFDDTRPITTATAARRKERDRKAVSVMADVNGAGRPLLREGEDGGSGTSSGGNGGIVKFRQLSNRLQSRPLSLDVEAAVRKNNVWGPQYTVKDIQEIAQILRENVNIFSQGHEIFCRQEEKGSKKAKT